MRNFEVFKSKGGTRGSLMWILYCDVQQLHYNSYSFVFGFYPSKFSQMDVSNKTVFIPIRKPWNIKNIDVAIKSTTKRNLPLLHHLICCLCYEGLVRGTGYVHPREACQR